MLQSQRVLLHSAQQEREWQSSAGGNGPLRRGAADGFSLHFVFSHSFLCACRFLSISIVHIGDSASLFSLFHHEILPSPHAPIRLWRIFAAYAQESEVLRIALPFTYKIDCIYLPVDFTDFSHSAQNGSVVAPFPLPF